jgi:hypothetical protein
MKRSKIIAIIFIGDEHFGQTRGSTPYTFFINLDQAEFCSFVPIELSVYFPAFPLLIFLKMLPPSFFLSSPKPQARSPGGWTSSTRTMISFWPDSWVPYKISYKMISINSYLPYDFGAFLVEFFFKIFFLRYLIE